MGEPPSGDPAEVSQTFAAPAEDRAQKLGQREHILPVRHRCKHVLLDPLPVQKHALLLAAGAEVPRPAVMEIFANKVYVVHALCRRGWQRLLKDTSPGKSPIGAGSAWLSLAPGAPHAQASNPSHRCG